MPQIGPNTWKAALSFYWWREYQDGRVEQEFDLETGQIRPWGSRTPKGLKRVGWVPVTPDLAEKMRAWGEYGVPVRAPTVIITVKPGDEPQVYKEPCVYDGYRVQCKCCHTEFRSLGRPKICPGCGARIVWECPVCSELSDSEICPHCKGTVPGRFISPFKKAPEKWEETEYFLGIKGKFLNRFTAEKLITEY